jgi:predicted esterase
VAGPERLVVAPEALSRFYRDGMDAHREVGASWMTREDRDAEIRDYVEYLDALVDRLRQASGDVPAGTELTLLGFSQGAATASRWALRGTADVDRLVLWAGALAHDLDLERHAERLRGMNLTVVVGDEDPYVSADRRDALRERLAAHAVEASFVAFDGGHRLHRDTLRRLAADEETTDE